MRDSTLREGLDTPGIQLTEPQKTEIVEQLVSLGISTLEIVGPSNFETGLSFLTTLGNHQGIVKSAVVYANCPDFVPRITSLVCSGVNSIDVLVHISELRHQLDLASVHSSRLNEITESFCRALTQVRQVGCDSVGIGLGDVFRTTPELVFPLVRQLSELNPSYFILYDTVGTALPLQVSDLTQNLLKLTSVPLHCHFHNDLGMATANTIIALQSGCSGADVTIGGLGDRAGNACLEEVALVTGHFLELKTGIELAELFRTVKKILAIIGVSHSTSRPIIGNSAFVHSTGSHLKAILSGINQAYEPFPPEIVGQIRRFQIDDSSEFVSDIEEWAARIGITDSHIAKKVRGNKGRIVTENEFVELFE